jgi:hypothetical protein
LSLIDAEDDATETRAQALRFLERGDGALGNVLQATDMLLIPMRGKPALSH